MTLSIDVRAVALAAGDSPLLAILVPAGRTLPSWLREIDKTLGGALGRTFERGDFRGGRDETLHLSGAASGPARVLLVGMGPATDRARAFRRAATLAARQAHKMSVGKVGVSSSAQSNTERACGQK